MPAWSHSQWKAFQTCPKKIGYRRKGIREPMNRYMSRGNRIHKDAEDFLLGKQKSVPATLANFKDAMIELRKKKPTAEEEIAVTESWERVDWRDKRAWLRYKIDANYGPKNNRKVIDFKTGKIYLDDHTDQLELYALAEMKIRGATKVSCEAWYFDQHEILDLCDHTEKDVSELEEKWTERARELLEAQEYPATPGYHCGICGYNAKKGGPCEEAAE